MSQNLNIILTGSVVALTGCLIYRMLARGQTRRLASAAALGVAIAVATLIVPGRTETRSGDVSEIASVVICYLSMLLGMMAEIGFTRAEHRDMTSLDRMTLLMPVFASPIVFIPLLSLMTDDAMAGGAFRQAKLMVYLVAFQNGFFWKSFFEQRRLAASRTAASARV